MSTWMRLQIAALALVATFLTCTHGLKIDFSRLALRRPSFLTQKRNGVCDGEYPLISGHCFISGYVHIWCSLFGKFDIIYWSIVRNEPIKIYLLIFSFIRILPVWPRPICQSLRLVLNTKWSNGFTALFYDYYYTSAICRLSGVVPSYIHCGWYKINKTIIL